MPNSTKASLTSYPAPQNPMVGSAVDPPAAEGEDDEDAVEVEEEGEAKPSRVRTF